MSSPIEQSCRHCGLGRRLNGTLVPPFPGVVCPGHDFQIHSQDQNATQVEAGAFSGCLHKRKLDVLSPSKADTLLDERLVVVSFEEHPLSLQSLCTVNPLSSYKNMTDPSGLPYITSANDTLREAKYYPMLTKFTPEGLHIVTRDPHATDRRTLNNLFPHAGRNSLVNLPLSCEHEIFVKVDPGSRKAPFTSEQKSIGSGCTFYSEVCTYAVAALVESFFPTDTRNELVRVYEVPPVAFAITGAGYMSHVSLLEWVGQLRLSPWSDPFFLGSDQHANAISSIDATADSLSQQYSNFVEIDLRGKCWHYSPTGRVSWATLDGNFWKYIEGGRDARGEYCRDLYRVYRKYKEIFSTVELPVQLVPATLYFGQFAVAVRMAAVGTGDVTTEQLETDAYIQKQVAIAIVFLARHGLLYTDLRAYNVRRTNNSIWLVDYDDMIIVENLDSYAAFVEELRKVSGDRTVAYLEVEAVMNAIKSVYDDRH